MTFESRCRASDVREVWLLHQIDGIARPSRRNHRARHCQTKEFKAQTEHFAAKYDQSTPHPLSSQLMGEKCIVRNAH